MPAAEPVAWDTERDEGPLASRRRWIVAGGAAATALVVMAVAVWMFSSPGYEKFCAGGGAVGAPVRPTAEQAFEAWAGDAAGEYEQQGDKWVREEGEGRTREAYVRETNGGYIVDSASDCTRYPAD